MIDDTGSGMLHTQLSHKAKLPRFGELIDVGVVPVEYVRVEVLDGEFLYAIKLRLESPTSFNLCPADYCRVPDAGEAGTEDGVSSRSMLVEGYTPPQEAIQTVQRLTRAANIDVGGVEYLINDRDGGIYYYDINALSNFVADAPNVVGFDPFPKLVDFVLERAGLAEPVL